METIKMADGREVELRNNTAENIMAENVKSSIRRQLPQVQPHDDQDVVIAIVGGGPSLEETFDDLKEKHANGMKVISTNASHDWLIERGIRPSAHIQLDARDFNARFVENWQPEIKYLIASQCHPEVFNTLEGANVTLFHCAADAIPQQVIKKYYMGNCYIVAGGSTVMLRAIPLMRMLGFKKMEIYGFDSCVIDNKHHSYKQEENNEGAITTIEIDGKKFVCFSWMYVQAKEFIELIREIGNAFELQVHGNGLIAHILETGAKKLEVK